MACSDSAVPSTDGACPPPAHGSVVDRPFGQGRDLASRSDSELSCSELLECGPCENPLRSVFVLREAIKEKPFLIYP